MTELTTDLRKGRSGWRAETIVPLHFDIEGKRAELRLTTYKGNGTLDSYAAVQTRDGGFTTMRVFRDYHARYSRTPGRCTEKNVKLAHAEMVGDVDRIKDLAIEHHAEAGDLA